MDYLFNFRLITWLLLFSIAINVQCKIVTKGSPGFGPGEQDWDYVEVRKGAHMFWWLYYTTSTEVTKPSERPLAIWLQGGPGASSTGYGNFEEFGPLDVDLNPRNFTWVKDMNVLFIDSPVGTGFSYVDDFKLLAKNNDQIAKDLVELVRGFMEKLPEFKSTPLHIFSESYGGKVAVEFAYQLNQEIQSRTIDCNLKSVVSIDGWVSPMDSVYSWAPFLYHMGFVDGAGHDAIAESARATGEQFDAGNFTKSTFLWGRTEAVILEKTNGISFYNVMTPTNSFKSLRTQTDVQDLMYRTLVKHRSEETEDKLTALMRRKVSKALNIPKNVVWDSLGGRVFGTLVEDFMKPVIHIVEKLLNETSIDVHIVTGQLDLIVATPGTITWVEKVRWPGAEQYQKNYRKPIIVDGIVEGYQKIQNKFTLHWINRAGHMVPFDNPMAMNVILKQVTKYQEYKKN